MSAYTSLSLIKHSTVRQRVPDVLTNPLGINTANASSSSIYSGLLFVTCGISNRKIQYSNFCVSGKLKRIDAASSSNMTLSNKSTSYLFMTPIRSLAAFCSSVVHVAPLPSHMAALTAWSKLEQSISFLRRLLFTSSMLAVFTFNLPC